MLQQEVKKLLSDLCDGRSNPPLVHVIEPLLKVRAWWSSQDFGPWVTLETYHDYHEFLAFLFFEHHVVHVKFPHLEEAHEAIPLAIADAKSEEMKRVLSDVLKNLHAVPRLVTDLRYGSDHQPWQVCPEHAWMVISNDRRGRESWHTTGWRAGNCKTCDAFAAVSASESD